MRAIASREARPVETTGGPGTRDSHWRETVFATSSCQASSKPAGNPISRMTVASLQDMGYVVDLTAAEPYMLPNLLSLAEEGRLVTPRGPFADGVVLTNLPVVLPPESLV